MLKDDLTEIEGSRPRPELPGDGNFVAPENIIQAKPLKCSVAEANAGELEADRLLMKRRGAPHRSMIADSDGQQSDSMTMLAACSPISLYISGLPELWSAQSKP